MSYLGHCLHTVADVLLLLLFLAAVIVACTTLQGLSSTSLMYSLLKRDRGTLPRIS